MAYFHSSNTPVRAFDGDGNDITALFHQNCATNPPGTKPDMSMIKRLSLLQLDSSDKSDKLDSSDKSEKSYKYRHLIFHDRDNQYFACCLCYGVSMADDNIILRYHMNPAKKQFPIKWEVGGGSFSNAFKHIWKNHPEFVSNSDLHTVSNYLQVHSTKLPASVTSINSKQSDIRGMLNGANPDLKVKERILNAQCEAIAHGQLPINLLCGDVMKNFVKQILNRENDGLFYGRTKISETLTQFLRTEKTQKKITFNEIVSNSPLGKYVAVTTDMSTGKNYGRYYVATFHFIDENVSLVENVLSVKDLDLVHSGENNRAITVKEILIFFGIINGTDDDDYFTQADATEFSKTTYFPMLSSVVHTITGDCASNNATAFDCLPSTFR